ncbi:hypothetical protein PoB_001374000 [Plakobranchus ocellatus]|uniref:Uncharacterized protein n=1 Tax=Plakobranchus ocellatus TaxID=259542 RepID=A0AAV3YXP2_9GAST|nr:hypothetical protein PoB_001374000 [Plakobranchus ocellatus]
MALDSSLVGVIGASAALFVIFCILAVIIGCFCLRRAKKRRQQQLVDKILQKQKEERQEHSHHSSETLNKPPSLAARSNGGGSMARSDGLPHKMADYRPKILEESMISHGYRSDTRPAMEQTSANRGGNTISTIFVNENKHSDDADNNNLDYNQNNGFIVKGYLHNSHRLNQSPQNGAVPQGYVPYVYPVPYYEDMRPARQGEPPKERQVFKQKVEMGPDGRLVVARSHQEHGYWTGNMSTEPRKIIDEAGSTKGEADRVLPSTTSEQTRVVSFSQESDEEQSQKISQTVTEDLKEEPNDRRPSPPAMANEEERKDGVEDQVEHATGMKTPNLDNYKGEKDQHDQ